MRYGKTRSSTILIAAAVAVFVGAGVLALLDGHASGRAFAAGFVGLGLATAGLTANSRACAGWLAIALEHASISARRASAPPDANEARAQGYAEGYVDGIARRVEGSTPS